MGNLARKLVQLRWCLEANGDPSEEDLWTTTKSGGRLFVGKPKSLENPKKKGDKAQTVKVTKTRKDGTTYTRREPTPEWLQKSTTYKFARMAHLAKNIDAIGAKHDEDLGVESGPSKKKATATAAAIMRQTGIRVGGGQSTSKPGKTKGEPTYGMTTLQKRHVTLDGDTARFNFRGKAGKQQDIEVRDPKLAKSLRDFLGGKDRHDSEDPLFSFPEGKETKTVNRKHVAAHLKGFHKSFEAKDLRTLVANETASKEVEAILKEVHKVPDTLAKCTVLAKKLATRVAKVVSKKLGNTPAVALEKYINPELIEHLLRKKGLVFQTSAKLMLANLRAMCENGQPDSIAQEYPTLVALFGREAITDWLRHHSAEDDDEVDQPETTIAQDAILGS